MIKDHGTWTVYTPATLPTMAPAGAIFAQRDSDAVDWYDYVHPGTNFEGPSVKFTVQLDTDSGLNIIHAPQVETDRLFPGGMQVVELPGTDYSGYTHDQLISMFAGKVIDLTTGDITDPPPPVARAK
jgi:hypothetical protein